MSAVRILWLRTPALVRAVLAGAAVAAAGTLPWTLLVSANTRWLSAWPWAVPLMTGYLWCYWQYFVRGRGPPSGTAMERRANARANSLPDHVWGSALVAGMLGLVSVLLLQGVLSRVVAPPQQQDLDPSQYPLLTVVLWVVMSAVVAGVVEETSFRGYMQRPIERRHGFVIAVLVSGVVFGLAHFTHPEVTVVLLPYYVAVAAVYGGLAYTTDSVFPSMVLHAGGNLYSAFGLMASGRSEWQLGSASTPLIWETGPDAAFVGMLAALLVVGSVTAWAYVELERTARETRSIRSALDREAAVGTTE